MSNNLKKTVKQFNLLRILSTHLDAEGTSANFPNTMDPKSPQRKIPKKEILQPQPSPKNTPRSEAVEHRSTFQECLRANLRISPQIHEHPIYFQILSQCPAEKNISFRVSFYANNPIPFFPQMPFNPFRRPRG